jgi:hypothetical protein
MSRLYASLTSGWLTDWIEREREGKVVFDAYIQPTRDVFIYTDA